MELTILGSGTGLSSHWRNAPGYLVDVDGKLIMLDSGDGTKRQLLKTGHDLFKLNYIFYTHTNVDHVVELPALLWPFIWGVEKNIFLKIFGPPKFKQFYDKVFNVFIPTLKQKKHLKIEVKEVRGGVFKLGRLKVKTRLMRGRKQTNTYSLYEVGYRLTYRGRSLVFCGDSNINDKKDILALAKGCDLLILEAGLPRPSPQHITPEQAGQIAQEAGAKRLLLTHFYPRVEKINIGKRVRKYYHGSVILARDLMKIKI
jgi:ribonuclease BN (tRNA processing enzyme)